MSRIGLFASVLFLAACSTTGVDSAGVTGDRECFRSESVSGFNVIDRNTVEVRVGASRRYRAEQARVQAGIVTPQSDP